MKISKFLLLSIFSLALFTCGSDDDSSADDTPEIVTVTPTITVDVDAILDLPTDPMIPVDITDLVDFGQPNGVSTADYTAELSIGDVFRVTQPNGLQSGDIVLYDQIEFDDLDFFSDDYIEYINCFLTNGSVDETCSGDLELSDYVTDFGIRAFNVEDSEDIEWKYDMIVYIRRGGTDYGPYVIDPKLRLKGRNTLN